MAEEVRRGRPRKYDNADETHNYFGEWRIKFQKEWEETTALLRRIDYRQRHEVKVSDSLYI